MLQTTASGTQQTVCPLFQDWAQALSATGSVALQTGESSLQRLKDPMAEPVRQQSSLSPTSSSSSLGARVIQQILLVQMNPVWCHEKGPHYAPLPLFYRVC